MIQTLLTQTDLSPSIQSALQQKIDLDLTVRDKVELYFHDASQVDFTPVFIYHEGQKDWFILFSNRQESLEGMGLKGSVLSLVRYNNYDDRVLPSDCFGQLSCSSCAIEVLAGAPLNKDVRDEEYDMLSIDTERPPTPKTRLGCQTVVGDEAMIIKVRA